MANLPAYSGPTAAAVLNLETRGPFGIHPKTYLENLLRHSKLDVTAKGIVSGHAQAMDKYFERIWKIGIKNNPNIPAELRGSSTPDLATPTLTDGQKNTIQEAVKNPTVKDYIQAKLWNDLRKKNPNMAPMEFATKYSEALANLAKTVGDSSLKEGGEATKAARNLTSLMTEAQIIDNKNKAVVEQFHALAQQPSINTSNIDTAITNAKPEYKSALELLKKQIDDTNKALENLRTAINNARNSSQAEILAIDEAAVAFKQQLTALDQHLTDPSTNETLRNALPNSAIEPLKQELTQLYSAHYQARLDETATVATKHAKKTVSELMKEPETPRFTEEEKNRAYTISHTESNPEYNKKKTFGGLIGLVQGIGLSKTFERYPLDSNGNRIRLSVREILIAQSNANAKIRTLNKSGGKPHHFVNVTKTFSGKPDIDSGDDRSRKIFEEEVQAIANAKLAAQAQQQATVTQQAAPTPQAIVTHQAAPTPAAQQQPSITQQSVATPTNGSLQGTIPDAELMNKLKAAIAKAPNATPTDILKSLGNEFSAYPTTIIISVAKCEEMLNQLKNIPNTGSDEQKKQLEERLAALQEKIEEIKQENAQTQAYFEITNGGDPKVTWHAANVLGLSR